MVRIAATGGPARAYRLSDLDAPIWTSRAPVPAAATVLGFDADAGTLLLVDGGRRPWRVVLGAGTVTRAADLALDQPWQLDGSEVLGLAAGALVRIAATEGAPWRTLPDLPPTAVAPLRSGAFVHAATVGARTLLMRWQPPDSAALDTLALDRRATILRAAGGDRAYVASGGDVLSIATRTMELRATIGVDDSVLALVPTPSGDRLYVLGRDGADVRVTVLDKYTDAILTRIPVPPTADALRMDPLGRTVLVRFGLDSVVAISIADDRVGRPFASGWRDDLPQLFPDGRVAALRAGDVLLVTPTDGRTADLVAGGGSDVWTVVTWNGFQRGPNAAAAAPAPPVRVDTAPPVVADSGAPRPAAAPVPAAAARDTLPRPRRDSAAVRRPPPAPAAEPAGFLVQFAALRAEGPARQLARSISVDGQAARVVATGTEGIPVFRVILGPYRSRAEAERAGQASGRDYYIYDGGPP